MQSNSIQSLTKCLCDDTNMPLLRDPVLREVGLCYKALPQYETFVMKRETKVKKRIKEGEEAKRGEEKAKKEMNQSEEQKHKQKKEQIDREIPKQNRRFLTGDNQPIQ